VKLPPAREAVLFVLPLFWRLLFKYRVRAGAAWRSITISDQALCFFGGRFGIALARSVSADENVREGWAEDNVRTVQEKLRDGGFYSGEIDGAYSSDLALALTRYQIRNGLPITSQLG